ncbi:hypothetical protein HN51_043073 [Arachis hypogaea]
MGEMLLGSSKENIPVVIIRPTIITSTYKEPFPGWIEGTRTVDSVVVTYGKGKLKCFILDQTALLDMVSKIISIIRPKTVRFKPALNRTPALSVASQVNSQSSNHRLFPA